LRQVVNGWNRRQDRRGSTRKPLKHYAAPWTCNGSEPYLFGPGVPRKQAISTKAQMPMPALTEPKIMLAERLPSPKAAGKIAAGTT
jgi:hypothetical protein